MRFLVIDASVTAAWLLVDEVALEVEVIETLLEQGSVLVPQIWHIEVRSALLNAERRGRITYEKLDDLLRSLRLIPVTTDTSASLDSALNLARKHRLSIYDAIYLELALRTGSDLATQDKGLAKAAQAEKCLSEIRPH